MDNINFKILNINTPTELFQFMKSNFKFGYVSNGKVFIDDNFDEMEKNYKLSLPSQLLKNKRGVCWDFVEFERAFFEENDYKFKTYAIVGDNGPLHTFLVYKSKNDFYYFEYAWEYNSGIYKYKNLNELLKGVFNKMKEFRQLKNSSFNNPRIIEYKKISSNLSFNDYKKTMLNGVQMKF